MLNVIIMLCGIGLCGIGVFALIFFLLTSITKNAKRAQAILDNQATENARQIARGYNSFTQLAEQSNEVTIAGLQLDVARTKRDTIQQEIKNFRAEVNKETNKRPVLVERRTNAEEETNTLNAEIATERLRRERNEAASLAVRAEIEAENARRAQAAANRPPTHFQKYGALYIAGCGIAAVVVAALIKF